MYANSLVVLLLLSILSSLVIADDVTVIWNLQSCNAGSGFGFGWSATDAGETFKPDAKNGMMVPCDEYFEECFSFVDLQGNAIIFPSLQPGQFFSNIPGLVNVNNEVITATIQVENGGFGVGFVSFNGATYAATGQPFTASCGTTQPNFRIRTNYLLTSTNNNPGGPNYIRSLNSVTDTGALGFGEVVAPYPNPTDTFALGFSACNSTVGVDIRYSFPAYGTALQGLPPATLGVATYVPNVASNAAVTNNNGNGNGGGNQLAGNANNGNGNGLSAGAISGIVIAIVVVAVVGGFVGFVVYRKRRGESFLPLTTRSTTNLKPVFVESPVIAKPLPQAPQVYEEGTTVWARFSGDGKEYRAIVEAIRPGPQYLIKYVDFGNDKEWLPALAIRAI